MIICKRCDGEGDVQGYEYGGFPAMFTCKACDGKGWVSADDHTPTSEMDVAALEIARNMVQSPDNWPPMRVKQVAETLVAIKQAADDAADLRQEIVAVAIRQQQAASAMLAALKAIKALTDTGEPDWNDAIGDRARTAIAQAEAAGIKAEGLDEGAEQDNAASSARCTPIPVAGADGKGGKP